MSPHSTARRRYAQVLGVLPVMSTTNLLVTDTIPSGATYIGGGTQAGSVVTWTLGSLLPDAAATLSFVVTATQTITNSDYRVAVDGRLAAVGQAPVVKGEEKVWLS
jgi:hypothetical protein